MKKYLFSAFAICLAAGAVAFTTPRGADVYFSYQLSTAGSGDVQDKDNWVEVAQSDDCTSDNQACQIVMDQDDLVGTINTGRVLSAAAPSLTLGAQDLNSDSKFAPIYVSGPAAEPINKP